MRGLRSETSNSADFKRLHRATLRVQTGQSHHFSPGILPKAGTSKSIRNFLSFWCVGGLKKENGPLKFQGRRCHLSSLCHLHLSKLKLLEEERVVKFRTSQEMAKVTAVQQRIYSFLEL